MRCRRNAVSRNRPGATPIPMHQIQTIGLRSPDICGHPVTFYGTTHLPCVLMKTGIGFEYFTKLGKYNAVCDELLVIKVIHFRLNF
jgi:hypothetical protein